jgi:aromatic-L-amino-acid decarboxylase
MAQQAEAWIDADPDFELVTPRSLSLFNFRFHPQNLNNLRDVDGLNENLLNRLNDTGRVYLTQNRVRGKYTIRWSIGQTNTKPIHVKKAWSVIKQTANSLLDN